MDSAEITRDELLKLISVTQFIDGSWRVDDVKCNVSGSVLGNIGGRVYGNVGGTVCGDVEDNVEGNVVGDIGGDVYGHVGGSISGNIGGSVSGTVFGQVRKEVYSNYQLGIVASQQQMYWVSLVGWEVWDAWYASRADVRSAADGVVAASKKMAAANLAESAAWLAMKEAAKASPLFSEDAHAHHRAERITR